MIHFFKNKIICIKFKINQLHNNRNLLDSTERSESSKKLQFRIPMLMALYFFRYIERMDIQKKPPVVESLGSDPSSFILQYACFLIHCSYLLVPIKSIECGKLQRNLLLSQPPFLVCAGIFYSFW